jgi:hypothetical protein
MVTVGQCPKQAKFQALISKSDCAACRNTEYSYPSQIVTLAADEKRGCRLVKPFPIRLHAASVRVTGRLGLQGLGHRSRS